ncbi:transmembrane protein 119b [Astyanax mexicanus]|uniref:transmembrane protein 119b n=1 Tax=Astyanax mexicanus TaxID=7994 RepID=UPI0020CB1E5C|nr:transmembrane protein 119b [Astyanax mexicanus]
MDHSVLCCVLTWAVILQQNGAIYATHIFPNLSMEGSGDWDEDKSELMPSPSVISDTPEILEPTVFITEGEVTHMEQFLLTRMSDFLRENLFLILVVTCLIVLVVFIVCSAVVLSNRRKVSAYYPCSFPSKMYVDETDKTGGEPVFTSVPEKVTSSSVEEPANSVKQLHEDIMLAARNLRSPTKTPWREEKDEKKPAEAESQPQNNEESEETPRSCEDSNTQEAVSDEAQEEIQNSSMSQDAEPVCHMEKTDPASPDLPPESEHPSGSDGLEAREETDKQEVTASPSYISEEMTAF